MIPTTSVQKLEIWGYPGMEVELGPVHTFSDEEFLEFCRRNPDARIERDSTGEIIIMAPTFTETGSKNSHLNFLLYGWAIEDGTGRSFESSTGFTLPNRALRSPDASWISNKRWDALSDSERAGFAIISPDFVIELRSASDRLEKVEAKMEEYIENGSLLGWFIDPIERRVHVYRPNQEVEVLDDPGKVSGEPLLPGFVLELGEIWG